MEQLLNKVSELRGKTKQYENEIIQQLSISPSDLDPRRSCFSMIFNNLTVALELLYYYHSIWSNPQIKVKPEEIAWRKQENAERCMTILKWLYIETLSSIEYSVKASVKLYGGKSPANDLIKTNNRIYLRTIMKKSLENELISNDDFKDWYNLLFIRNCVVHNNAISDCEKSFNIGGINVVTHEDEMIQGKLDFFAFLAEVSMDRYFTWVKVLINKYGTK